MEGKEKSKHRLKGLFRDKGKKPPQDEVDIDSFLHGSSDKLNFPAPTPTSPASPASPPRLSRIDTNTARRWPTAAEVTLQNARGGRNRAATTSPTRSKKGLVVRFTDAKPEIIGEGGDEAEEPTISLRSRANTHPPPGRTANDPGKAPVEPGEFIFMPVRRAPTGFGSIPEAGSVPPLPASRHSLDMRPHESTFAAKVKADMKAGEGRVLVQAASDTSKAVNGQIQHSSASNAAGNSNHSLDEAQINSMKNTHITASSGLPPQLVPGRSSPPGSENGTIGRVPYPTSRSSTTLTADNNAPSRGSSIRSTSTMFESPKQLSRSSTLTLQTATVALGDDALEQFSTRVSHLLSLFRLSSESAHPLTKYSLGEFMRVALWWFLNGRLTLEATIRDRPTTPEAQQTNFLVRQQAFADLAKSLWIIEKVVPEYYDLSQYQASNDASISDIVEVQQGLISSLRKLTMSMKRNNFLPPEDAPLPQGLDPSIWLDDGGNRALLAVQKPTLMAISDSMPLGDSRRYFQYARMFAKCVLLEEAESQQYTCSMLTSLIRDPEDKSLSMVVTNQSGTYTLCIRADGRFGSTWRDVLWHAKSNTIEVNLPRGFILLIKCSQHDFRLFWGIYDYEKKIHDGLRENKDERTIFDTTLKSMQYLDTSGTAGFPKEPLALCRVKIFEKILVEKAATGTRTMHRGYRIGLVTHPSTKNLRGINQILPCNFPVIFDFLRGDEGFPGFLLALEDGKTNSKILLTFNDPRERMIFHDRLTGAASGDEVVVTEVNIKSFELENDGGKVSKFLKALPWQTARVINREQEDQQGFTTVLSDSLRTVIGFGTGSLTDRLNLDQGELRIRLTVAASNELKILRRPQQDITCSTLESKGSKESRQMFAEVLNNTTKSATTRTYTFPSAQELHLFQTALTGFRVAFDGIAISFNISRRRMVVPIYKKWDAMTTRLQIVQKNTHVQLLAFFEHFSHGECMNFELKSTDVFESSGKAGKWSLRVVDAKFALPKGHGEESAAIENRFVCLDSPEYPGEHDDITIVFEHETERDNFVNALPAPSKNTSSRMSSLRK